MDAIQYLDVVFEHLGVSEVASGSDLVQVAEVGELVLEHRVLGQEGAHEQDHAGAVQVFDLGLLQVEGSVLSQFMLTR